MARRLIYKWQAGVDRQLLGKHFNKMHADKRTRFIAFFEHMDTNLHAHALVICHHSNFNTIAKATWAKLVTSGSLHISGDLMDRYKHHHNPELERLYEPLDTPEGRDYVTRYVLKEQWKDETYANFILSDEFLPK
ncbi:MAG: hypothetical protein MRY32_00130 [Rickettsiales bacterium]|nr:hypothetical protein [Rickettsiales bacterium]